MRRSLGFQPQFHADDSMWMETQAQQQSHAFHEEESWSYDNNYHKQQFPGMHMKPGAFAMDSMSKHHGKLGGSHGMVQHQQSMPGGHGFGHMHGGGKKLFPFGGTNNASHHFSNGGVKFNPGGHHHDYSSEEYEYEAYSEEHAGGVNSKMDEMRYEHHNWGGDVCYANPYDRNRNWKPHHGGHKVQWTAKGV
ncbi:hypothetical protein SESBI_50389 [Sesbania bispinosa]|nr:hypothetical protein SESBI_50389 [Sesbania bispinosa]